MITIRIRLYLESLLMIKQLIFLVGTILVSVTSEHICSVCGDGYQVGNPSALVSSFPGHPDKPATCKEIEVAGLEGLISISQCRSVPSLIFDTCHCQTMTAEKTREYANALNRPGYSSLRRVQATSPVNASTDPAVATATSPALAPSYAEQPASPVARALYRYQPKPGVGVYVGGSTAGSPSSYQYGGGAYAGTPTYQYGGGSYSSNAPYQYGGGSYSGDAPYSYATISGPGIPIGAILTFLLVCCIFVVCCLACISKWVNITQTIATPQTLPTTQTIPRPHALPTRQTIARPHALPTFAPAPSSPPPEVDKDAKIRRTQVLGVLFPNQDKLERQTEGLSTRSGLKYHPESKRYVFCDNSLEDTTCSICLECLGPQDDFVTGMCSHIYHRACIMDWLELGHDECPNCRQPMWDSETYKIVDQSIKEGHHPIPSAPLGECDA